MDAELFANVFRNTFAIIALLYAFTRALPETMMEWFRHDLFEIRRELFLLMADGVIDKQHPAYVRLRDELNGLLRRAEELTGLQIIAMSLMLRNDSHVAPSETAMLIRGIQDKGSREKLDAIQQAIGRAIVRHIRRLQFVSPPLLVAFAILRLRMRIKHPQALPRENLIVRTIEADGFQEAQMA